MKYWRNIIDEKRQKAPKKREQVSATYAYNKCFVFG